MANSFFRVLLIFLILIFSIGNTAGAVDEQKLIDSAEKLIAAWEHMITKECFETTKEKDGGWSMSKMSWVQNSAGFDIKRTNSIISPYILIISFNIKSYGSNYFSPNANYGYSDYFKRVVAFKNPQDARANVKATDFLELEYKNYKSTGRYVPSEGVVVDMVVRYAYQKGFWVMKDGNESFEIYFTMGKHRKEKIHRFNLIKFLSE